MSTWQLRARRRESGCEETASHDNGDHLTWRNDYFDDNYHERDEYNDKNCDTNCSEQRLKAQRPRRGHIMIVTSICFVLSFVLIYLKNRV